MLAYIPSDPKQMGQEEDSVTSCAMDPLLPARIPFKVSRGLKTIAPVWDQVFKHMSPWWGHPIQAIVVGERGCPGNSRTTATSKHRGYAQQTAIEWPEL